MSVVTRSKRKAEAEAEAPAKVPKLQEAEHRPQEQPEAGETKHEMQAVIVDWQETRTEDRGRYPHDWNIDSKGPHKTTMDLHRIEILQYPPKGDVRSVFEEIYRRVGTDMCPTKVRWMIVASEYQAAFILLRLRYHRLWEHVNLRFEDRSYNHNGLRTVVIMTTFPKGATGKDGNPFQVQTWQETVDKYTNYGNEGPRHSPDYRKKSDAKTIMDAFEAMEKQKAETIEMKGQKVYDTLQDDWYNMDPHATAKWEAAPMLDKRT